MRCWENTTPNTSIFDLDDGLYFLTEKEKEAVKDLLKEYSIREIIPALDYGVRGAFVERFAEALTERADREKADQLKRIAAATEKFYTLVGV